MKGGASLDASGDQLFSDSRLNIPSTGKLDLTRLVWSVARSKLKEFPMRLLLLLTATRSRGCLLSRGHVDGHVYLSRGCLLQLKHASRR